MIVQAALAIGNPNIVKDIEFSKVSARKKVLREKMDTPC
jgi:hypothetical protein